MQILAITLWKHVGGKASSSADNAAVPIMLISAKSLSSFSYFQQGTIAQAINASTRIIVQRTSANVRQTVQLDEMPYRVHVYVRADGLAGTVVTDREYPERVAFSYLNRQMQVYEVETQPRWAFINADQNMQPAASSSIVLDLAKFQNPAEADKLTQIQSNLNEITEIMHRNINEVLKRGENLDDLMTKSDDLSAASQVFYKQAKKTNQCCQMY